MASKNPFGMLNVRRDDDDEEVTQTPVHTSTTGATLFSQTATEQKKKKKVRPEEKKRTEDVRVEEDTEEGFSVVKKKMPTRQRPQQSDEPQVVEEKIKQPHLKNKGAFDRVSKVPAGKRQFEKHSGTGRGREIAKGGAGGKHTWGANPKNVAREREEEYNEDDDIFNRVLNAKPRQPREQKEQEVVPEETKPEVVETPKEPEVVEVAEEKRETEDFDKRKKRRGEPVEVNKEDLLERPENALSYAEYMEQLKLKNQALGQNKARPIVVEQSSDLKPQAREDSKFAIGLSTADVNKKPKAPKEKKTEAAKELNPSFKTGDEFERRFDNRENKGEKKTGNKKGRFQFTDEDFPQL